MRVYSINILWVVHPQESINPRQKDCKVRRSLLELILFKTVHNTNLIENPLK